MAARLTKFCSFGIRLFPSLKNHRIPQVRNTANIASVGFCMKPQFVRNQCSLSATKESSTNFKATSYEIRKLCKNQRLQDANNLLDSLLIGYGSTNTNITSVFNCILYHVVKNKESKLLEYLLQKQIDSNIKRDRATFYNLALYYSEHGMLDEGIKVLREMQAEGLKTSPRNYLPLIGLAARLGDLGTAFSLYDEMKGKHNDCHQYDAVLIHGVVNSAESSKWRSRVLQMLHNFKSNRVKLNQDTSEAVVNWFTSQSEDKWQVNCSTVNSSGICQSCNHTLESGALTSLEHAILEQHIIDYLWCSTHGRKLTSFTTIGSFADKHYPEDGHHLPYSLEKYISETGPYDVVLDALNVAYYGNKGEFHPEQVEETAEHFLKDGKKVLVVGAPPMLTKKLRNDSQGNLSTLIENSENCGLFLICIRSNKSIPKLCIQDDIFILLAAIHCGLNTILVSNDLFQDHMHKLPFNAQALLGRWLRSNQVLLTRYPNNQISYKKHPTYDHVVQTTGNTWHLPLEDNVQWLCINKIPQ